MFLNFAEEYTTKALRGLNIKSINASPLQVNNENIKQLWLQLNRNLIADHYNNIKKENLLQPASEKEEEDSSTEYMSEALLDMVNMMDGLPPEYCEALCLTELGGMPLAPVMSFWIASPSMDPEIFFLSTASIGWELSVWRLAATFAISLSAGYITHILVLKGLLGRRIRAATKTPKHKILPKVNSYRKVFILYLGYCVLGALLTGLLFNLLN